MTDFEAQVAGFLGEKDFEAFFYSLDDPIDQLRCLQAWRRRQIRIVPKFIDNIGLNAHEQYKTLDHFLLELLQNADDNEYAPDVTHPSVEIELRHDALVLTNNEIGFTPQNVFAITYAAATTKTRKKTGATYIGEKGIGFKSVFAVAEHVDIHSGPYHLRLKDNEYIVPHLLDPRSVHGTEITVTFRRSQDRAASVLSECLQSLCDNAQEFTLFLQRIEKLTITDRVGEVTNEVTTLRDAAKGFFLVESGGVTRTYASFRYPVLMPKEVVVTRFPELDDDLVRDVVVAVPHPPEAGSAVGCDGRLFCYLPTEVRTGTPIHVQVDAKTTTSRENILPFANSEWNRRILEPLAEQLTSVYLKLAQMDLFKSRAPEYWPCRLGERDLGNTEVKELMATCWDKLRSQAVVQDRNGILRTATSVVSIPGNYADFLYEDKYEAAHAATAAEDVRFVSRKWASEYPEELEAIGVQALSPEQCLKLLRAGVPAAVRIDDAASVRRFLTWAMDLAAAAARNVYSAKRPTPGLLRSLPIFPVKEAQSTAWRALDGEVSWMQTGSRTARGNPKALIVDPEYTYAPGGREGQSAKGKSIRAFNKRFRDFLEDTLEIHPYSRAEFLRKTAVVELSNTETDPDQRKNRHGITEKWGELYTSIWRRRKTIQGQEGDEYWNHLLADIAACRIPVRSPGDRRWRLEDIGRSFLGPQFDIGVDLRALYQGTEAPIVELDLLTSSQKRRPRRQRRQRRKTDWADWREFLLACGAKTCPYGVPVNLIQTRGEYRRSSNAVYENRRDLLGTKIARAVRDHWSYDGSGGFKLSPASCKSFALDLYTKELLKGRNLPPELSRLIAEHHRSFSGLRSTINFIWGYKRNYRTATVECTLLRSDVYGVLPVVSNLGVVPARSCFLDTEMDRRIASGQFPLVDSTEWGGPEGCAFIGVRTTIELTDAVDLLKTWYEDSPPGERTSEAALELTRPALQLGLLFPGKRGLLRDELRLYSRSKDELLPYDQWLEVVEPVEYPQGFLDELSVALHGKPQVPLNPAEAVAAILSCSPLEENTARFWDAAVSLGEHSPGEEAGHVRRVFMQGLADGKLVFRGRTLETRRDLPLIWDLSPTPARADTYLVLPDADGSSETMRDGLRMLRWPLLSEAELEVQHGGEPEALGGRLCRRIHWAFREIIRELGHSRPSLQEKLKRLRMFQSEDAVRNAICLVDNLTIKLSSTEGQTASASVIYWFAGGQLYVDRVAEMQNVLPEFVDSRCGTTLSGLFRFIWSASAEATDRPRQPISGGKVPEGGDDGANGDVDSLLDDEDTDETEDDGKRDQKRDRGPRKRIVSYVLANHPGGGGKRKGDATRTEEIDKQGAEVLREFFESRGFECVSKEKEKCGYDFEVQVGEEVLYIELKSSRDRWEQWEQDVTPNEFFKAKDLADKYFLCCIERLGKPDQQMYFIQDPAGKADGFLFDAPWKRLSIDMPGHIWRLKSDQDILEE